MNRLIEIEEVVAKGEELGATGLRQWYDQLLAERTTRRNTIRLPFGAIEVGKTYDITYAKDDRRAVTRQLKGWVLEGRASWSDNYLVFRKPPVEHPSYGGARRELSPAAILEASPVEA